MGSPFDTAWTYFSSPVRLIIPDPLVTVDGITSAGWNESNGTAVLAENGWSGSTYTFKSLSSPVWCFSRRRRCHACSRGSHQRRVTAAAAVRTSRGTPTRSRSTTGKGGRHAGSGSGQQGGLDIEQVGRSKCNCVARMPSCACTHRSVPASGLAQLSSGSGHASVLPAPHLGCTPRPPSRAQAASSPTCRTWTGRR